MNNQEIKTRRHVKYVLENYPQSRGSSGEFMIFFINVFYLGSYSACFTAESPESILRHRRYLQNTLGKYKPLEASCVARRGKEKEYKRMYAV
jgi:hypothetical protein